MLFTNCDDSNAEGLVALAYLTLGQFTRMTIKDHDDSIAIVEQDELTMKIISLFSNYDDSLCGWQFCSHFQ